MVSGLIMVLTSSKVFQRYLEAITARENRVRILNSRKSELAIITSVNIFTNYLLKMNYFRVKNWRSKTHLPKDELVGSENFLFRFLCFDLLT